MGAPLLAVLVASVLLAALARRYDVSAPLALVVAGLAVGLIPGVPAIEMQPQLVMFVVLPPLLWSAGLESSYLALRKNIRPIGMLAVGLPLATTLVVGFVAFHTVPELTVAAALTLGAGGWRIAIIDKGDDMNDAASNALLKILEEPPDRSLLMVLADAPAR